MANAGTIWNTFFWILANVLPFVFIHQVINIKDFLVPTQFVVPRVWLAILYTTDLRIVFYEHGLVLG